MPENASDIILGLLGTSVSLAGLLLVFCGFVFSQAANFPAATTADAKIKKYRDAGVLGLWPFLGAIADSLGAVAWLLNPSAWLYCAVVVVFIVLLIATAVYGAVVTTRYL